VLCCGPVVPASWDNPAGLAIIMGAERGGKVLDRFCHRIPAIVWQAAE